MTTTITVSAETFGQLHAEGFSREHAQAIAELAVAGAEMDRAERAWLAAYDGDDDAAEASALTEREQAHARYDGARRMLECLVPYGTMTALTNRANRLADDLNARAGVSA